MSRAVKVCLLGTLASLILGAIIFFLGLHTTLPGPDSKDTILETPGEALSIAHGIYRSDTLVIVLENLKESVDNLHFLEARESLVKLLQEATDSESQKIFISVKTLGHSWLKDELYVSKDLRHLLIIAQGAKEVYRSPPIMQKFVADLEKWKTNYPSFALWYSSSGVVSNEIFALINYDLDTSLRYTVPITLAILVWTFGSLGASFVAATITALSLISSLGIASLISHLIHPISATAAQLVVLIVMAIGTDYALFYIARLQQELNRGLSFIDALEKSAGTTGRAIIWSGLTVAVSLTGLLLVNDPILTSMAAVSIIAVVVTLFYTLKILPALLLTLKNFLDWGRIRNAFAPKKTTANKWVLLSVQHPRSALSFSLLTMLSLSFFCWQMSLGSTMQPELLPQQMQSSQTFKVIKQFFPQLAGTDLTLILHAKQLRDKDENDELLPLFDRLQSEDRMHGPIAINWSADGTTARFDYKVDGTSQDDANRQLIQKMKNVIFPAELNNRNIEAYLTGKLIFDLEQEEFHKGKIFVVLPSILGASLIFLMIAFESIVIPIKAFFLNILSTAAAFGVLVLLFQLFGWQYGVIESFVPSLLFSILFGLSMDYHLLLISRIQEYVKEGLDTKSAVVRAISETYAVISGAAVIMTSVFLIISLLELPLMKQLGIGLAFAVILDATIIRCMLLPASVILLGDLNWYMPQALKRLIRRVKVGNQGI